MLFIGSTITLVASGELGRTHAADSPTPAAEQPKPTVSPFVKAQTEVVRRDYAGRVLGSGVARLTDGSGHAEANARNWVAWSDGKKLFIDVQGILPYRQVKKVRWRVDLANGVTRFTVNDDDPEAVWFYGNHNYDVDMGDLLRLFSSGFRELQVEDLPSK